MNQPLDYHRHSRYNLSKSNRHEQSQFSLRKEVLAINISFLKKAIKAKGFTQEEFAEKINIGYATLKKYFRGETSPSIDVFRKICDVLGCNMEYLLSAQDSHPYLFHDRHRDVYSLLKDLGYTVCCNPDDEDQIQIDSMGVSVRTTMPELTRRIDDFIKFEIYRLSHEKTE